MGLIANKVVDELIYKKKKGILCKLDMEKTYDHVHWNFVDSILSKMGFGRK